MTDMKKIHSRSPSPSREIDMKKLKIDLSEEARDLLIKQLEYYFSDENLRKDSFFQNVMRSDPKSRLYLSYLLKCSKVKNLGITREEQIEQALEGHNFIIIERNEEDGRSMLRLLKDLPELEVKKKFREKIGHTSKDHHAGGCIVKVSSLPENISWIAVKDELKAELQKLIPNGENLVRYVSQTTQNGTCYMLLKPFLNDQNIVKEICLTLDDIKVPVVLVGQEEARKVITTALPRHIQKEREKEINKQRMIFTSQPILIGGQQFASIEHLRRCLKEVLEQSAVDTVFDGESLSFNVLKALLHYHPKGSDKTRGMHSITVKYHPETNNSKCFFILRKNEAGQDEMEDFSVSKCLQQLARNPPLASKLGKNEVCEDKQQENIENNQEVTIEG
ncbi:LA domain-containing protein [Cryptosporidium andersoni]|uniref:LA domain-containing protein n=1 Tax=Cryptosporidium andersoni TaxID=117008 RepID=A0A1J4MSS6_9CRYT|nr:LA domain-containing protein [Cryptosporidium andersoni]